MIMCKFCKKESPTEICHNCKITMAKKKFSEDAYRKFIYARDNITEISNVDELKSGIFSKTSKIKFICDSCHKEYLGTFNHLKNKTVLLCRQCTLEQSNIEKYGKKNIFETEDCKEKIKTTINKKYGADYYLQTDIARQKRKDDQFNTALNMLHQKLEKYSIAEPIDSSVRITDDNGHLHFAKIRCTCLSCGNEYITNIRRAQRCDKCYPEDWLNGTSKLEKEILCYIRSIYSGPIEENTRNVISPRELDIYLSELKLAVEIDGDYWHGCSDYSIFQEVLKKSGEKQKRCHEMGIRLVTIKECDYIDRPDVFKRFLDDCIMPRKRIFARKCEIKEIDTDTARDFCNYYHVNGYRGGYVKYGLYDKEEGLICVAVFGKNKDYENECIRLCYKTGISIIGGWEKIQKHFGKKFLHYVNLQYFDGENKTGVGFRFKKDDLVLSRNTLQRNTQLKKYCKNFQESLSDAENLFNNGFIAIFDCGNDRRIYN